MCRTEWMLRSYEEGVWFRVRGSGHLASSVTSTLVGTISHIALPIHRLSSPLSLCFGALGGSSSSFGVARDILR